MFKKLFKLFNKNITPAPEINNNFITNHRLKGNKVRINSSIEIPENFSFVVVINGKVLDVLSSGRHRVNGSIMPGVFDKLNLGKPNKNGKLKKWFKAKVYYVNLNVFERKSFSSNKSFVVRGQTFGRVKGYAEGTANIQIRSADEVVKYLLKQVGVIKPKNADEEICLLVGNAVNAFIERNRIDMTDILLNSNLVYNTLNPAVDDLLYEVGVGAENINLVSLKLTKKMQKKVNEFLSDSTNISMYENKINTGNNLPKNDGINNGKLPQKTVKMHDGLEDKNQNVLNVNFGLDSEVGSNNSPLNNTSQFADNQLNSQQNVLPQNHQSQKSIEEQKEELILPNTRRFSGGVNYNRENKTTSQINSETESKINDILNEFNSQFGNIQNDSESNENDKQINRDKDNQTNDDSPMDSYINKRATDTVLLNSSLNLDDNKNYKKQEINAEQVLKDSNNKLKQCKYCGSVIEDHFKFCPKCGFKQA